jgi:DNA-directed RNA polymerase specialized sigma24 family protein
MPFGENKMDILQIDTNTNAVNLDTYLDFQSALKKLNAEELVIFKLHFLHGLSLNELAFVFEKHMVNMCIQRKKIINKLKRYMQET